MLPSEIGRKKGRKWRQRRRRKESRGKVFISHLVNLTASELPVGIIRPSIVSSSWKEPFPGWTDNFNGPIGICLGIGTGVLHYIPGDPQAVADIVPVDIVANYMIAVGWYLGNSAPSKGKADPPVFNCTSGDINPCTWGHWGKQHEPEQLSDDMMFPSSNTHSFSLSH